MRSENGKWKMEDGGQLAKIPSFILYPPVSPSKE
jgi:hypothetical protein